MADTHHQQILEQFTKQATTFGAVAAHSSEISLRLLAELSGLNAEDGVLDVACGPGIVSCEFAQRAKHVTGVDVVPAMLQEAEKRQNAANLSNVDWQVGSAMALPFASDRFSLVVTRYSFHHILAPEDAFRDMVRVCRRGGRIAVCDVTPDGEKSAAYDALEKLRDPSHVHAIPMEDLEAVSVGENVRLIARAQFYLEMALEDQLSASFPDPGGAERIRELVTEDLGVNNLGMNAHLRDGQIWYKLPSSVLVWMKL